jgi:helix-turn-helix protein
MYISVEATRWAWTESLSERSARLVMLAIAAHCNEDGYSWPGLETIMRCSRLSKPIVLEALQKLTELKELTVEKGGKGAGDTNRYYLCAFMESRVNKGKENPDKGKETVEKGYTRVDPNKNLEQRTLEEALDDPEFQSRVKDVRQRLDAWNNRCWQTDEHGKRYLVSPSSGQRVYEEALQ